MGLYRPMGTIMRGPSGISDVEADRLAAVRRYEILDTPADGSFDRVTAIAAACSGFRFPSSASSITTASGSSRITGWRR